MKIRWLFSLLILAFGSTFAAEVDQSFLQASAALDRVLIPALMAMDEKRGGDAEDDVARLAEAWQSYHTGQDEVLSQAGGWSLVQNGVTRRIELAGKFVRSEDISMAYVMLSQVREDLVRIRMALDAEYFVDQLVLIQAAMDGVLGDGSRSLAEMDRNDLVKGITGLEGRWTEIREVEFDAENFGFLWKELSNLNNLMEAEGDAIRDLRTAAASGVTEDLDRLADVVRSGFFEVYLMFGGTE